jgi:hypothetical protein
LKQLRAGILSDSAAETPDADNAPSGVFGYTISVRLFLFTTVSAFAAFL